MMSIVDKRFHLHLIKMTLSFLFELISILVGQLGSFAYFNSRIIDALLPILDVLVTLGCRIE